MQVRATASGIAGGLHRARGLPVGLQFGFVGPTGYNFALSVQMLFGLVIGGMYSLAGAILGGLFLQFFPDVVAGLGKGLSALLYAVLLIAAIVRCPTAWRERSGVSWERAVSGAILLSDHQRLAPGGAPPEDEPQ